MFEYLKSIRLSVRRDAVSLAPPQIGWDATLSGAHPVNTSRVLRTTASRSEGYSYLIPATVRGTIIAKSIQTAIVASAGQVPILREILNCDATCAPKC
jgi:hypothetical protein